MKDNKSLNFKLPERTRTKLKVLAGIKQKRYHEIFGELLDEYFKRPENELFLRHL